MGCIGQGGGKEVMEEQKEWPFKVVDVEEMGGGKTVGP
jgi:hypothetical protein